MTDRPPSARETWEQHRAGGSAGGGAGISFWTPPGWEESSVEGLDLVVLGPGGPYRPNVTAKIQPVPGDGTLDEMVQAAAAQQQQTLQDFLEYERLPRALDGVPAVERQYAWFEQPPGIVFYQHQVAAIVPGAGGERGTLVQVHATCDAPAYFRFAALFRRILDSLSLHS